MTIAVDWDVNIKTNKQVTCVDPEGGGFRGGGGGVSELFSVIWACITPNEINGFAHGLEAAAMYLTFRNCKASSGDKLPRVYALITRNRKTSSGDKVPSIYALLIKNCKTRSGDKVQSEYALITRNCKSSAKEKVPSVYAF